MNTWKRMRLVSDRLDEERLLSELKLDVLKAGLDYKGNVKIEFSDKGLLMDICTLTYSNVTE